MGEIRKKTRRNCVKLHKVKIDVSIHKNMAYANVIFKTVLPVATGFGLWYLLIDRGNNTIREEFEKSHGKGKANDASPLIRKSEKKRPKSVDKLPKSITNYRWKRGISEP